MPARFTREERFEYLKQFGSHCISYATLQPGMEYFDVPGMGYLAFMTRGRRHFILGEPVCAGRDRCVLIRQALQEHADTTFVQVHHDTARFLHEEFGFRATQMGIESLIRLASWDVGGNQKQLIRSARNHAVKAGIEVVESERTGAVIGQMNEVSRRWLETRKVSGRQMAFLVRPITSPACSDERWLLARAKDEIVGFACFDPIYSDHKIVGYHPNISRASPLFRRGIFYVLMLHAVETFRGEGVERIDLGMSPLSSRVRKQIHHSGPGDWLLTAARSLGHRHYNFAGIEFTKARFCGEEVPVYCAHRSWFPLGHIYAVLKLCNVI
jgi:phosphatidylglycerol lysyltransferase